MCGQATARAKKHDKAQRRATVRLAEMGVLRRRNSRDQGGAARRRGGSLGGGRSGSSGARPATAPGQLGRAQSSRAASIRAAQGGHAVPRTGSAGLREMRAISEESGRSTGSAGNGGGGSAGGGGGSSGGGGSTTASGRVVDLPRKGSGKFSNPFRSKQASPAAAAGSGTPRAQHKATTPHHHHWPDNKPPPNV